VVRMISGYCPRTISRYHPKKIAIKMKAVFNQCIICVNNNIEKFYRPRITKQIALFCTKEALIGEAISIAKSFIIIIIKITII